MGKYLALLVDMSGFKSFSEAPHLAQKCGTHRSDSPIRGFVVHHAEVAASRPNPGCCFPLCGFLAVIQLVKNWGHKAE
jgi:hypothetical protein